MCPGDNSSRLSARYINAQLSAMHRNAVECVGSVEEKTVDMRAGDYEKHMYTRSLAQFHVALTKSRGEVDKEDLLFNAKFGEPHLDFICNHEAALSLKLQNGHFNRVYPTKVNAYRSNDKRKDNVSFKDLEVVFRLKFSRTSLSGKDSRIGNGAGLLIQLMVLDFSSAQMVSVKGFKGAKSTLANGTQDSLQWYLMKYLTFLQKAGHHVRFDLPDFDADAYKPYINYSLTTPALRNEELCANVTVHGIGELQINHFLRETWLDVISKALGFGGKPPTDELESCLTEIKSTWLDEPVDGHHFHIRFGPPRVRALCNHEVVLYLTAAKVDFFDDENFNRKPVHSFVNWEFAFVVDVVPSKIGHSSSLTLDLRTARFSLELSAAPGREEFQSHFTAIRIFLISQYLTDILLRYNMHCIYYPGGYRGDQEPDFGISEDESEWEVSRGVVKSSGVVVWSETIKRIVLHGFDRVVAVSEESINTLFSTLYKSTSYLAEWNFQEAFHTKFSTIRIKLLSGSKALVTFTINSGHFTMLKDRSNQYKFEENKPWTISYEVDIKMVDHRRLFCDKWSNDFDGTVRNVFKQQYGEITTFRHILLDFHNARYIYKHSAFPGMWGDKEDGYLRAVDRLESFIYYMRQYLELLSQEGLNIIHSTPIFPSTHQFGMTAASFQIVSRTTVTISNCMFEAEPPVIMVVGMTCGRPLSSQLISWGSGWVLPGKTHGTICLSSASFLESKLLTALELVNRRTTVVPRFPLQHEEEWKVYLTTWDRHQHRKDRKCEWTRVASSTPDYIEYEWEHRDEWSYEHQGTHKASGFSALCHTKNQLCIPINYRPQSMEIILRGESILRLKSQADKESKRSSAKWSARIRVNNDKSGLRVAITETCRPVFDKTEFEGQWDIDTHKLLEEHLPRAVDITELIRELKLAFEGAWEYSFAGKETYSLASPVFTPNGDLVVHLRGFTEKSTSTSRTPSSTPRTTPAKGLSDTLQFSAQVPSYKMPAVFKINSAAVAAEVDDEDEPLTLTHAPDEHNLKLNDSVITRSSSAMPTPLLTPPAVDAEQEPLIADGSERDDSFLASKMELPKVAPPVETAVEPDVTFAGF